MVDDNQTPPPELVPCDCCGVPVAYRRGSIWHGAARICRPCFHIWFDGNVDSTDPAAIRAERLRIYGQADTAECLL